MKKISLIVAFVAISSIANAQLYAVDSIPAPLKNKANAVVRESKTVVDMRSVTNVELNTTNAVTVFNKSGERYAQLALFYDKNTSIKSVKGEIYDEFGKQITKFSLSNFKDESAVSGFSLFEDSRVKYYIPQISSYPYTIVYTYEIRNKQNLVIPQWSPVPGFDIAVEKSSFQFLQSPIDEIRIHAINYQGASEELNYEKQKSLYWSVQGIKAIKKEAYAPNPETYFPSIKIAPVNFNYYNLKGAYTDWQGLGKITYDHLLKDRQALSPETIASIKDLVKDETSDRAKAKKIYEHFQKKTRYISVQIGIGGLQPIKASDVDRLGYGDCKALVNYMQSLLNVAGIESYYCVVEAGEEKTDLIPSFASMEQGNHIILCLPLKGDTTWLECTSQDAPFGYLGSFTDDRWVLACTKDGGKLMKTPKFEAITSRQIRIAKLSLSKNGTVEGVVNTTFDGSQFDNHAYLLTKSAIERERALKYIYDINNIEFKEISLSANKDMPLFTEKLGIDIDKYGHANNDKLQIRPNLFNVKRDVPASRNRTLPLELKRGYTDIDSISFTLGEGIVPIVIPKTMKTETKFGTYEAEIKMLGGQLVYSRKLVMRDGIFGANDYEAFESFVNEIANYDSLKLTLALKK
ncbi:DUF3857 domain-containing protein [Pedobacter chitinilyticus]|uniref:DUF3857 domain-containing protein n=1 Tax=Pedobacter chitinilyticus TaxID=2233776 RepID=A0A3S3PQ60_9SPHI|nr:DUF3857 domain-containing protein [Pedobacter chitinilyticus]RWU10422.1 DUF3857 domain-containing protein [Pedobacter chitinilyticus]